jgi:hypothetical protein
MIAALRIDCGRERERERERERKPPKKGLNILFMTCGIYTTSSGF